MRVAGFSIFLDSVHLTRFAIPRSEIQSEMSTKMYYENEIWLNNWLEQSKKEYVKAPGYVNRDVRFRTLVNFGFIPTEVHSDESQKVKVLRGVGLDVTIDGVTKFIPRGSVIEIQAGQQHELRSVSVNEVSFQSEYKSVKPKN